MVQKPFKWRRFDIPDKFSIVQVKDYFASTRMMSRPIANPSFPSVLLVSRIIRMMDILDSFSFIDAVGNANGTWDTNTNHGRLALIGKYMIEPNLIIMLCVEETAAPTIGTRCDNTFPLSFSFIDRCDFLFKY